MEIILLERIGRLGQIGDVVRVKDGFARNYLLPRNKALRANKANRERFELERVQIEARNLELKSEAATVAEKLDGQSFIVVRQAGEMGQLYGSVSSRDISELIVAAGFTISRTQVVLDQPIKTIGVKTVVIALHPEVTAKVSVNVARSADEAERQARGEQVLAREVDTFEREVGPITDEEGYADEA
ncbi:MAG: 50S ribosomal protein L9 [Ancalomicrobiaceae bacterium]|nr:50S ribosomal protein L9 [Ancalomicrobiaceae bacterium]